MRADLDEIFRTKRLSIEEIAANIHRHVDGAYDAYIPITGREGKGKSTLSIHLLLAYLGIKEDTPEALNALQTNIRYAEACSVFKVLKFYLDEAKDNNCYVFDEAERMASKYDSSRLEARVIRKYWTLSRKRRIVSIMNMPMLANFDIYMRSGRAYMALNCVSKLDDKQAIAVILYADEDATDAFHLKKYYKLKEKLKRPIVGMTPEDRIRLWAKLPSFAGIVIYNPLPKPLEDKYFELANTARQYSSVIDELKEEASYLNLYQNMGFRRRF